MRQFQDNENYITVHKTVIQNVIIILKFANFSADITEGGNANGASCVFPFTFNGASFTECTDLENRGVKWCSTTPNYDANRQWGRCICDVVTRKSLLPYLVVCAVLYDLRQRNFIQHKHK